MAVSLMHCFCSHPHKTWPNNLGVVFLYIAKRHNSHCARGKTCCQCAAVDAVHVHLEFQYILHLRMVWQTHSTSRRDISAVSAAAWLSGQENQRIDSKYSASLSVKPSRLSCTHKEGLSNSTSGGYAWVVYVKLGQGNYTLTYRLLRNGTADSSEVSDDHIWPIFAVSNLDIVQQTAHRTDRQVAWIETTALRIREACSGSPQQRLLDKTPVGTNSIGAWPQQQHPHTACTCTF